MATIYIGYFANTDGSGDLHVVKTDLDGSEATPLRTSDGRLWCFYVDGDKLMESHCNFTEAESPTAWSTPAEVCSSLVALTTVGAIELSTGRIMVTFAKVGYVRWRALSDDGGATWTLSAVAAV